MKKFIMLMLMAMGLSLAAGGNSYQVYCEGQAQFKAGLAASTAFVSPNNLATVNLTEAFNTFIINAATIATLNIVMPVTYVDGQMVGFSSVSAVTALALTGSSGQTIKNAPTALTAGGAKRFMYRLLTKTWYVID